MFRIIIDKIKKFKVVTAGIGYRCTDGSMHLKNLKKKKIQILSYLKYLQSTELSSDPD